MTPVIALLILSLSGAVLSGAIRSGITTNSERSSGLNTGPGFAQSNGMSPLPGKAFLVSTINVGLLSPPSQQESSSRAQPAMFRSKTPSSTSSPLLKGPVPLASTSSTVSVINGFDGLGQAISGQPIPPDVQVAAGPNHLVEMVNLAGEVFTKQGAPVTEFSLYSFFNTASPKALSDPKILYDAQSGRWFASILIGQDALFIRGNATLAVSTSNDPTGTWNLYRVIIGDFLPDQPLLGVSDDKVVVSVNDYPRLDSGGFFEGAQYFVLNKSQLLAGASSVDYDSIGPDKTLESVYPVQSLSTTTTQYLVSVGAGDIGSTSTKVKLFSITGIPPNTVTVTNSTLTVATISNPPNAVEAGTTELIQTDDFRIESAAWFQGSLWYSLNDGCIPSGDTQLRSCVRLTKLNTTTPSVVQDFDLGANGQYYYYPALSIDNTGGMDLVYGFSSSTLYPSLAVTGQAAGANARSLASSIVLVQGTAPDTAGFYFFSSVTRYGDFFGASLDPSNSSFVWVSGEYHNSASPPDCQTGNCWSTFIGSMTGISGYTLSANPAFLNIPAGSSGTSTINVQSLSGFQGTIALSASISRTGPTASLSPSSVSIPPSPGSSTLTITVPSNLTGTFTVTVTGTSGSISHSITLNITVNGSADFTVSTVQDMTGPAFACGCLLSSATLTITSVNGFSGNVQLSATLTPANASVTFSPSTVYIAPGSRAFSLIAVNGKGTTPDGLYSLSITGTSGSTLRSANVAVALASRVSYAPDFPANNPSGVTFAGYNITTSGSLAIDAPTAGSSITVSGTITITSMNATTGAVLSNTTYTVLKQALTPLVNGGFTGRLIFNVTIGPYPLDVSMSLSLPLNTTNKPGIPSDTIRVSRNTDINENGIVDASDINYVQARRGCSTGMSCYDPRADLNADGIINLSDALIVNHDLGGLDYNQNLYTLAGNPSTITLGQGTTQTSIIMISNTQAFAGTVSLSVTSPSGLTTTLAPSSILISGTSTLTVIASSSITPGTYTITVTGNSGYTTHSTMVTVIVTAAPRDFTITAVTTPLNVPVTGSATSTITLSSTGGFSGTVTLSVGKSYSGETATINPSSLTLTSGGTGSATLTVASSTLGIYSVTVTGTSSNLSHSVKLPVYVTDFFLGLSSTSVDVLAGSGSASGDLVIGYSINGASTVTLSSTVSSTGLTVSYGTSNPINVPPAGFGKTVLGFTSSTTGIWTVTLKGTSGILTHQVLITVRACNRLPCGGGQASFTTPESQALTHSTLIASNRSEFSTPADSVSVQDRRIGLVHLEPSSPITS